MNAIDNCLLENFTSGVPYNELSANTVKGGGDQVYELNFDKEYLQNTNFNNYADHLLSNAEVLRQARIVYEADLTNQEIIRKTKK